MRSRFLAGVLALTMFAAACGGPADTEAAQDTDGLRQGLVSRVLAGEVDLEVSGAVEAEYSGPAAINVLTNVGGETPRDFWQLTVGMLPQHILELDGGTKIRPAFDLLGFEGDGSYTIQDPDGDETVRGGTGGSTPPSTPSIPSGVVFVVSQDNDEDITNYNSIEEPCTVEVGSRGTRGSIECPRVSDGRNAVAFSWSWQADPDEVLENLIEGTTDASPPDRSPADQASEDRSDATRPSGGNDADAGGDDDDDRYGLRKPYQLDVDITPEDCATRGTGAVVHVDTIAHANITLVVVYSDGQPHGNTILGNTGATGTFSWPFNVSPEAPDGQADLIVNVGPTDASNETESAGGVVPAFEVRTLC